MVLVKAPPLLRSNRHLAADAAPGFLCSTDETEVVMVIRDTYHGQWIGPGGRALDPPPMPEDRPGHLPEVILHGHAIAGFEPSEIRRLRDAGPPVPGRAYPHVRMTGNYNLGCIDTQILDYYGITPEEAHRLAWEAFGRCVHVIAYFDEDERLAAGE